MSRNSTNTSSETSVLEVDPPFGLSVLQNGEGEPRIQIIFVHGLGGTKRGTWTCSETQSFWPSWLHDEEGFENIRIALFGYNASYNFLNPNNIFSIPIFAKLLLVEMKSLHDRLGAV